MRLRVGFIACMPAHGSPDRPDVAWPWVVHSGMRGNDGMASSMGHCVAACGRQVWAEFDPRATGTIRERQLRGLVSQIECPLGVKKPDEKEWKVADAQVAVCGGRMWRVSASTQTSVPNPYASNVSMQERGACWFLGGK